MKIIKNLFFQSLLLTSVLISFNVNAADQSICNPGANVVLHDNGLLKSCQLKDNYDVNNITCKNDSIISFYSNGELESCILYTDVTISNSNCKANALIYFFVDGNLKSCMK